MQELKIVCPKCLGRMTRPSPGQTQIVCSCGSRYPVVSGAVLLMAEGTPAGRFGLAEATFKTPAAYSAVVRLKRLAFRDARIGTEDVVRGKDVLDVGCGPSLDYAHLENHHRLARTYHGIDTSAEFVISAARENPGSKYLFVQAPAGKIPFPDKAFDTAIVSFTIHHVSEGFDDVMRELIRVSRSHIVILDHLRSENPVLGGIQSAYWRFFDGGCAYQTKSEWGRYLKDVKVERTVRTGAIFGHVVKFICTVA